MCRAVARSENPGGHVVLGGDNVSPLVEIGLIDLPKTGRGGHPGSDSPAAVVHCARLCLVGLFRRARVHGAGG